MIKRRLEATSSPRPSGNLIIALIGASSNSEWKLVLHLTLHMHNTVIPSDSGRTKRHVLRRVPTIGRQRDNATLRFLSFLFSPPSPPPATSCPHISLWDYGSCRFFFFLSFSIAFTALRTRRIVWCVSTLKVLLYSALGTMWRATAHATVHASVRNRRQFESRIRDQSPMTRSILEISSPSGHLCQSALPCSPVVVTITFPFCFSVSSLNASSRHVRALTDQRNVTSFASSFHARLLLKGYVVNIRNHHLCRDESIDRSIRRGFRFRSRGTFK